MDFTVRMRHIMAAALLLLAAGRTMALELGEWTHYLSYDKLTHVVPADAEVFAVSDGRLFSYNTNDDSMTAYGTSNALSDNSDITDICWNRQTRCLVIAYDNGNVDLMDTRDHSVVNCHAIKDEVTTRSKTIRSVACGGQYAYVVMPYGVVTVDTKRKEVGGTYRFSTGDCFIGACVENDSLFLLASRQLEAFDNATIVTGSLKDNLLDIGKWQPVKYWKRISDIYKSIRGTMNNRRIYNFEYQNQKNEDPLYDSIHDCYWTIASDGTLMMQRREEDGSYTDLWAKGRKPDGPASNSFYHMHWLYGQLYTASEGWRRDNDSQEPGIAQKYSAARGWSQLESPTKEQAGVVYRAVSDVAVDPRDTAHVMVAAKSGLYEFYGGRFVKRWYNANSPVMAMNNSDDTSNSYQIVLSAAYDRNGTLWVLNSLSGHALLRLDQTMVNGEATESTWQYMEHSALEKWGAGNDEQTFLSNAKWDKEGNLWFVNMHIYGVAYYCYNPATDVLTEYRPTYNQDGTSLYDNSGNGYLTDINLDAEGNVWLCGTKGVCYLPARSVGTETNVVEQYKVARNDGTGLADYLLSTVSANCIIFDGAGRKYIGTEENGVYVISADNETEVANYTAENSPLLHDNVRGLAIDPSTGTLYCATERGLCSVTTDAVSVPSALDESNVKVYPNPVSPAYTGMITIEGLTVGADIKITTATGRIVHTGRTQSAIYQWDGCDFAGNRCASGVYNVLVATADASEGCVAKIAMVK